MSDDKLMPESKNNYNDDEGRQSKSNDVPINDSTDEADNGPGSRLIYEVSSDLGEYWDQGNGTVTTPAADLVLSMIRD